MKTAYQADDGSVHSNVKAALKRDRYIRDVNLVTAPFYKDEIAHGEFIQRTATEIKNLEQQGLKLLKKYNKNYPELIKRWEEDPRGFVGRLLDDGDIPVYRIWCLLFSIDKKNRQWDQPYYAIEANKKIDGQ